MLLCKLVFLFFLNTTISTWLQREFVEMSFAQDEYLPPPLPIPPLRDIPGFY